MALVVGKNERVSSWENLMVIVFVDTDTSSNSSLLFVKTVLFFWRQEIVKSIKLGLYKYSNVSEDGEISESSVVCAIKVFDTEYGYTDSDTSVEETNFYIVNI